MKYVFLLAFLFSSLAMAEGKIFFGASTIVTEKEFQYGLKLTGDLFSLAYYRVSGDEKLSKNDLGRLYLGPEVSFDITEETAVFFGAGVTGGDLEEAYGVGGLSMIFDGWKLQLGATAGTETDTGFNLNFGIGY